MKLHPSYTSIASFFSCWSLPQATARLNKAIVAASANKIYEGRSPAELIYFIEQVTALLKCCDILVQEDALLPGAILGKSNSHHILGLTEHSLYCGWVADTDPWDYFPRHISTKEFFNPYKAIKKVLNYQSQEEWQQTLKYLLEYALSNTAISEFDPEFPLLKVSNMLFKLVEACHLVDVRAINEDENGPRPKWKNKKDKEEQLNEIEESKQDAAYTGIKDFFEFFGKTGGQECLWEILKRALCNEADETSARDRSNMMFEYDEFNKLLAHVYVIYENRQEGKK